ncbi:hypothetical protein D3C81_1743910 [compost metagenome]
MKHLGHFAHQNGVIGIIHITHQLIARSLEPKPVTDAARPFVLLTGLGIHPVHVRGHGSIMLFHHGGIPGHLPYCPREDNPHIGPAGLAHRPFSRPETAVEIGQLKSGSR